MWFLIAVFCSFQFQALSKQNFSATSPNFSFYPIPRASLGPAKLCTHRRTRAQSAQLVSRLRIRGHLLPRLLLASILSCFALHYFHPYLDCFFSSSSFLSNCSYFFLHIWQAYISVVRTTSFLYFLPVILSFNCRSFWLHKWSIKKWQATFIPFIIGKYFWLVRRYCEVTRPTDSGNVFPLSPFSISNDSSAGCYSNVTSIW